VAHVVGKKRFVCSDESRNSYALALLTGGEGWHNTHHTFPRSAYFATRWFELDIGGVVVATLQQLGIIWDVRRPTPGQLKARAIS
jgi:stearoyl-CoA desaturase (delta-9 desaturase)